MTATSFPGPARESTADAFGSLIDLARLKTGWAHAEVCEHCNTINMGAVRLCKCCAHKLPAFYVIESPRRESVRAHLPNFQHYVQLAGGCYATLRSVVAHLASVIAQPPALQLPVPRFGFFP